MTPLEECQSALQSQNCQAFLHLIRAGESGQTADAYRTMFGGSMFDSFDAHPNIVHTAGSLKSTAAGAYQFLKRTWDEVAEALGLPDFSPLMQDTAAVYLIRRRGALADVLAGNIKAAISKCGKEWASLPGSPYGQPTRTLEQALATYKAYGGQLGQSTDAGNSADVSPASIAKDKPMAPLIAALLPSLIEAIPKLGSLFGSGSEVATRNVKAAEIAFSVAKEALGATNEQQVIEQIKADPAAAQVVAKAIEAQWFILTQEAGGGGIDGARKANAVYMQSGAPGFWLNPAFWISMLLMAMPFMLLADVFYVHPQSYVGEIRTQIVTGLIAVIGMVGGYWIGTSFSSAKKDERASS